MDILIPTNRLPEAVFFSLSNLPCHADGIGATWNTALMNINKSGAVPLFNPNDDKDSFAEFHLPLFL